MSSSSLCRPVASLWCLFLIVWSLSLPLICQSLAAKDFKGGAGVGRLILDESVAQANAVQCHYDMVLVERLQGKPPTESGLFVPRDNLPRLHVGRVLSMGPGREEENGRLAPMPDIQVGSWIIAKNPWGIGPKDEETTDGKKLSYMRSQDIAAVITGEKGILLEEDEQDDEDDDDP